MYCNATDLVSQSPIQFEEKIYSCRDKNVIISCPKTLENATVVDECIAKNQTLTCDIPDIGQTLRCTNGTLLSSTSTVCNATHAVNGLDSNETFTVLNCYPGELLNTFLAASIPTTTTTPRPIVSREEELSFMAKVHLFFLRLVGKGDEVKTVMTTPKPETTTIPADAWVPIALTVPPEPIENSTLPNAIQNSTLAAAIETSTTSQVVEVTTKKSTTISQVDVEDDYFEGHH